MFAEAELRDWHSSIRRLLLGAILCGASVSAEPWTFAVLGDTQWPDTVRIPLLDAAGKVVKAADDSDSTIIVNGDSLSGYRNPHMVAADFLHQIHERLRAHGIRFLVAAGDLSDWPTLESMRTRATWAQELYDAGVGVFPIRGNHDEGPVAAREFLRVFPQTTGGMHGATPVDAILWTDSANIHPFRAAHAPFAMGTGFSSPACAPGRSYAFRESGATFVLLDQFMGVKAEACPISSQIAWIDSVLSAREPGTPAFVIAHKPLQGACHADNLFGDTPATDSATTGRFFEVLRRNGVELFIAGHDHQLQHSLIEEPGARGIRIQQCITPGASYKLYPPLNLDAQYNMPAFGKNRETPLAQDLGCVGYLLLEVDSGSRVEISAWGGPSGIQMGDLQVAPDLGGKWSLRRRWGWSPRGKRTLLATSDSLSKLGDSALGTRGRVLSGVWKAAVRDLYGRNFSALASTDWRRFPEMRSAAWTLWGLERANGATTTPAFALSLGVDRDVSDSLLRAGGISLLREDSISWKSAGTGAPRVGVWKTNDPVGTHGVDPERREVWAVVDRAGTFAAGVEGVVGSRRIVRARDALRLAGRILSLPESWNGRLARIDVFDPRGRLVERGRTSSGKWALGGSVRGMVKVRCRMEDGTVLEQGAVLFP